MSSHDSRLLPIGRVAFAIALAAFGTEYLVFGGFVRGLIPGQDWIPPAPALAYAYGVALVAGAIALLLPSLASRAALALGILWIASTLIVNAAHLGPVVTSGAMRTGALEPLSVGAGALVLSAASSGALDSVRARVGRWLFAFTLVVFGVQHFLYADFIAGLILPSMPTHLLLVYVSGAGMVAAGLAIATGILARLAATLIALMFASWVVLLHGPLVAAHLHDGDHWSSLFVALAMAGAGAIVAAAAPITSADTSRGS